MRAGIGCCLIAGATLLSTNAFAAESGWRFGVAPYAWLSGVDATVSAGGRSASADLSFTDLISDVDMSFMGLGSIRYNRFVVFGQLDYVDLSNEADIKADIGPAPLPVGAEIDLEMETMILTLAAGYQFDIFGEHSLDVLIGMREFDLEIDLGISGNKVSEQEELRDAIIMLSPAFQLSEKWEFQALVSYGFAGDSDTTYELQPQLHYRIRPNLKAGFGYRKLYYDEKSGQKGTPGFREFDGDLNGFILGIAWAFGENEL